MTAQETLTSPAPGEGGLWRRYLDGDGINHAAWMRARACGAFVGTCRRCGGYLVPQRPDQRADRTDYEADCRNTRCGYVLVAPGGRVARGSTRRSGKGA